MLIALLATISGSVRAGEVIWDYGPGSGEYGFCGQNRTSGYNRAEEVIFDEFMELTGIDVWTCISQPLGDMEIKILFDHEWREPGPDYRRWLASADRYEFDGNHGGTDLYKVSFDFDPVLLRPNERYWIGVAGNSWELGHATVFSPGNGRHALFHGRSFERMNGFGDSMLQLRGRRIDPPFEVALDGECPGEMTASVIGATASGRIAFLYGQRGGETAIPDGPCRGVRLPVGSASLIRIVTADSAGEAQISGHVSTGCGTVAVVAVDLETCEVTEPARTYVVPELYTGPRIANTLGFADFNDPNKYFLLHSYDEGEMNFRYVHQTLPGFRSLTYCGGNGTPALYMGGPRDMLGVTRLDGRNFDAIEFIAGDGWVDNCVLTYLWIRVYLDGLAIADYTIDAGRSQVVGLAGGEFDEIRVGAYTTANSRNINYQNRNERGLQALAIDNVRFGALTPAPTLTLTGPCPGPMTADISNATPNGTVALIFGRREGQTPIPTGPCAGTILPLAGQPQLAATTRADPNGQASHTLSVPPPACGGYLTALDAPSCGVSHAVVIE